MYLGFRPNCKENPLLIFKLSILSMEDLAFNTKWCPAVSTWFLCFLNIFYSRGRKCVSFHNNLQGGSISYYISVLSIVTWSEDRKTLIFLLTFSFIFSIFFTELRRWCLSSSLIWKTGSPDLPICFSSCFSASFSLLSALMLSAWYIWYVFITCENVTQIVTRCLSVTPRGNGSHFLRNMLKISPPKWQGESQIVSQIDELWTIAST